MPDLTVCGPTFVSDFPACMATPYNAYAHMSSSNALCAHLITLCFVSHYWQHLSAYLVTTTATGCCPNANLVWLTALSYMRVDIPSVPSLSFLKRGVWLLHQPSCLTHA